MSGAPLDRRTALALLGVGALSPGLEAGRFFNPSEQALIDTLAEMIMPADAHSPGAREAGVGDYIDLVISASPQETQITWKMDMAAFAAFAERQCGKPFLQAGAAARARVLDRLASQTAGPATPPARFFARLRELTVFGYYSSEIGLLKELGYKGNQVISAFPGCKSPPSA